MIDYMHHSSENNLSSYLIHVFIHRDQFQNYVSETHSNFSTRKWAFCARTRLYFWKNGQVYSYIQIGLWLNCWHIGFQRKNKIKDQPYLLLCRMCLKNAHAKCDLLSSSVSSSFDLWTLLLLCVYLWININSYINTTLNLAIVNLFDLTFPT